MVLVLVLVIVCINFKGGLNMQKQVKEVIVV